MIEVHHLFVEEMMAKPWRSKTTSLDGQIIWEIVEMKFEDGSIDRSLVIAYNCCYSRRQRLECLFMSKHIMDFPCGLH